MLNTLKRIVQEVSLAPDLDDALSVLVFSLRKAMKTDVCSVYLIDTQKACYVLAATEGLNPKSVGQATLGLSEGLVGQVGLREEPVNVASAASHPKYRYIAETGEERLSAFLGVPIIHHGRVLGVLVVQHAQERGFGQEDEAFLITLSAQLAGVLAHAEAIGFSANGVKKKNVPQVKRIQGIAGSPGIAIGPVVVMYPPADFDSVPDRPPRNIKKEQSKLSAALEAVRQEIKGLQVRHAANLPKEENALFDVYLSILDEDALGGEVAGRITAGNWAQGALKQVITEYARNFELMDDPYLRERAVDIKDLGRRVLARLQEKEPQRSDSDYPEGTILVGEELSTAMIMAVPIEKLSGIVSVTGSSNSHMAIVARALGIPTVVGASHVRLSKLEGQGLIVDGYQGQLILNAPEPIRQHYDEILLEEQQLVQDFETCRELPCEMSDGHAVALWVNTGLMADVVRSKGRGAEGVGLYRTEIPFMARDRFPSEDEQQAIYRKQLEAFAPLPVTMRTLDIGGDKSLPYFPISEENPFLGWRGIRISLDHPEIFLSQIRAMLKASAGLNNLRILLPMISSILELEDARYLIHRAWMELQNEGYSILMPQVGAMIEVPGAVYQAREIAAMVDFISVGSNDLTQYMLAVDRNNPRVAGLYQSFHPAVLCALSDTVKACHEMGKTISVCGEMAGDPAGAALLSAMGYDSLSMSASSLLKVKWALRQLSHGQTKDWLEHVLSLDNAAMAQSYMRIKLGEAGLGGLTRAGK